MNRRKARESAFLILFEKMFNDINVDDIISTAKSARGLEVDDFALNTVNGVLSKNDIIDETIAEYAVNWSNERISKVSLLLLRIAIYEMMFDDDVPISVAINEAVELAKKYSTTEDTSFVNGVLGGISRKKGIRDV